MIITAQKQILTLLLSLAFTLPVCSQFYSAGQDPFSVRWKQINTENFQVIFPDDYIHQATYIADVLEWAYEHGSKTLDHRPRKVSVIVHNQTVISNGFVSWAPRRIELYTNPPANNDAHDWMERLAIHELRHVVQIDKLNQGVTRLLSYVFGEQATGAMVAFLPMWFLEGDAVVAETALTHAGRGRVPAFEQELRAQVLEKGIWSYDKALFGSYKHHVPNYYQLGYQLVAAARANHDASVWSGVVDHVARRPWTVAPFSRGMKKHIGYNKNQHYQNTFRDLDSAWTQQKKKHTYTQGQIVSPENKLYTSYNHAFWIDENTLVALKTGLRDIPAVVKIRDGQEKLLFRTGWLFPNALHYASGKLVWNQLRPDPRWEHRSWSEIWVYDFEAQSRNRLTHQGRYFAPSLSPDGKKIAAVKTTSKGDNFLVVLDAYNGYTLWEFQYPGNDFIMQPAWHPSGNQIALIAVNPKGKRIDMVTPEDNSLENILPPSHTEVSSPAFIGNHIIFTGGWSGIDQIFELDTETGKIKMIISPVFGAVNTQSSPEGEKIVHSDYSSSGYRLKVTHVNDLTPVPLKKTEDHSVGFHKILSQQEDAVVNPSEIVRHDHRIEKYDRFENLFHLHSWAPLYLQAEDEETGIGATLLFQNKLSTSFATAAYQWDNEQQTGKFSLDYSYHGWYPVIQLEASSGHRRFYYTYENQIRNFLWNENIFRLAFSVPLRFQQHAFFYGVTPVFRIGTTRVGKSRHTPTRIFVSENQYFVFHENSFYTQEYRLLSYLQRRLVARDIFPRWGVVSDISYRHTPLGGTDMGSVWGSRGIGYLPGLFRHQGLRLSAAYQEKTRGTRKPNSVNYTFGNVITYPRGFSSSQDRILDHRQLTSFTADYAFPLVYPDLSLPPLIYLKRLHAHVFTDFARATKYADPENPEMSLREDLLSYGFGITGDMHFFRFYAPVRLGVEIAFPENENVAYQLLMGVSF